MSARPSDRALATALATALCALTLAGVPAPAAAQSACGGSYTVDTGDTLARIAQLCGVTLPALVAENAGVLDDMDIDEGDRLRVPDPDAPQPTPVQVCGSAYTVRAGDTVAEIAAKCGLTIPLLIAANPPLPAPLGIHAGMAVRIPDVSRAAVLDRATLAAVRGLPPAAPTVTAPTETAPADTDAPDAGPPPEELLRVEGVLETGARCMTVRDAEGDVIAIAGEISRAFGPGDRVVLMGVPAAQEACGHSPTLALRILYRDG